MGQTLDTARRPPKDELLYQAALAGNLDAVKSLCREGARFEWFDQEGKTALITACLNPDLYDVAKTLIELGANVNAYRPGRNAGTPLHHAAKRGCIEIVKLLLSNGANALVMNDDCQTPLDVARNKRFVDVVRLIEHHVSFFTGWLREFHGPGFLGALAPQLLSKKVWVVVAPRGPVNSSKPAKLELAIYNTLQDSEPRTNIFLWTAQIDKPKFNQQDFVLRILDKSNGYRYKLGPATDGDKQQIELFYSTCLGMHQTISSAVDPIILSSVSTNQSATEDVELAMAISASMQTANGGGPTLPPNSHPSSVSGATNDWQNLPSDASNNGWGTCAISKPGSSSTGWTDPPVASSFNGWGASEISKPGRSSNGRTDPPADTLYNGWGASEFPKPGSSGNGWAYPPVDPSYNGWGALGTSNNQSLPIPTQDNVLPQPQVNNEILATSSVNPTAPPLPVDGFDEGLLHYPSIDTSPVDAPPNPNNEKEAPSGKTDASDNSVSAYCIICWETPVQGACVPCGHMAGCMSCLSEIKLKKGDCPVCRTKISQVIRLYAV